MGVQLTYVLTEGRQMVKTLEISTTCMSFSGSQGGLQISKLYIVQNLVPIHLFLGSKPPEMADDRREVL